MSSRIGSPAVAAVLSVGILAMLSTAGVGPLRTLIAGGAGRLGHANVPLLVLAAIAFGASLVFAAGGWHTALAAAGGRIPRSQACARYGTGSSSTR